MDSRELTCFRNRFHLRGVRCDRVEYLFLNSLCRKVFLYLISFKISLRRETKLVNGIFGDIAVGGE